MIPEFPLFKKIELSDKHDIEKITSQYPPYSDFNFVSMWCWNTKEQLKISQLYGNLIIYFTDYVTDEPFCSFLGSHNVNETIEQLLNFSKNTKIKTKLCLIADHITTHIKQDLYNVNEDVDNFDYIYNIKDLSECKGKNYETQRNLINRFKKYSNSFTVECFQNINEIQDMILNLDEKWVHHKTNIDSTLNFQNESHALQRIFGIQNDNLFAICIFNDGILKAFCLSELIPNSEYAISHFAKADTTIPGIYAFLFNQNCKELLKINKKFLNYEQDLGLLHLRHSKKSFRPAAFLKKHIVFSPLI